MKTITKSSPEEAVLEWLKAELRSDRFSGDLKSAIKELDDNETTITKANLHDKQENEIRWKILKSYRTWLKINFYDYEWYQVELSSVDVKKLNYIDYSYWNELSDYTRKVGRAAENVADGREVFDVPNDRFYSVAKDIENGISLPPIIIVSNYDINQGEIIEGHLRATGFVLAQVTERPLKAIWGTLKQ